MRAFKAELEEKTKIQDALNSELRLLKSESERSKRAVVQAETQMQEIREQYISGDGRTVRDMDRIIRELTTKLRVYKQITCRLRLLPKRPRTTSSA